MRPNQQQGWFIPTEGDQAIEVPVSSSLVARYYVSLCVRLDLDGAHRIFNPYRLFSTRGHLLVKFWKHTLENTFICLCIRKSGIQPVMFCRNRSIDCWLFVFMRRRYKLAIMRCLRWLGPTGITPEHRRVSACLVDLTRRWLLWKRHRNFSLRLRRTHRVFSSVASSWRKTIPRFHDSFLFSFSRFLFRAWYLSTLT